jgi:transglutaminase-like putative cysteine protease/CheY-like chemotaxis protein
MKVKIHRRKTIDSVSDNNLGACHVLILEPGRANSRLLEDMLSQELRVGSVRCVKTLTEAIKTLAGGEFNILISDWSESTDAIKLINALRGEKSFNRYLPVLVVTTKSAPKNLQALRNAGVDEIIHKPYTPRILRSRLKAVALPDRPFIETALYFGPDRRRYRSPFEGEEQRHHANCNYPDRRLGSGLVVDPERRHGHPGYRPPNRRANNVRAKIKELEVVCEGLDIPNILALRRITLADPQCKDNQRFADLDDFFTIQLLKRIDHISYERLEEIGPSLCCRRAMRSSSGRIVSCCSGWLAICWPNSTTEFHRRRQVTKLQPDQSQSKVWLRTVCEITFDVNVVTPLILMLRPRSNQQQWVARETYTMNPMVQVVEFTDIYGNFCQRLMAPLGEFCIRTSADILTYDDVDVHPGAPFDDVQSLPDAVLTYLLPTRYCESDKFIDLGQDIVAGVSPGYCQVAAIVSWIRDNVCFNPNSVHFQMSAVEVYQQREGVCRELAHLGIALCRGLCIPARMVVGYMYGLEPMDFHAWFEAYVGGRWYSFDPTQSRSKGKRVTVGYGRDAADVAIFNQFGPALYPRKMRVDVELLDLDLE